MLSLTAPSILESVYVSDFDMDLNDVVFWMFYVMSS